MVKDTLSPDTLGRATLWKKEGALEADPIPEADPILEADPIPEADPIQKADPIPEEDLTSLAEARMALEADRPRPTASGAPNPPLTLPTEVSTEEEEVAAEAGGSSLATMTPTRRAG